MTQPSPIKVDVAEDDSLVRTVRKPKVTLAQKLKAFDPKVHAGEAMVSGRLGTEVF